MGVDVTVLVSSSDNTMPFDPEIGCVPDFADTSSGYEVVNRLNTIMQGTHVVVSGWHGFQAWSSLIRARIARRLTLGIRFDSVGFTERNGLLKKFAVARPFIALRTADVWHPTGRLALHYAQQLSLTRRTSVDIPYVSDPAKFFPNRNSLVKDRGPLRILVVSKLNTREGVETAVRSVAMLSDVEMTVVGDGPERRRIEELASSLGAGVNFVGYVKYEDLPAYYHNTDLFIHPSNDEPWGVSVQEAMHAGVPVLASSRVGSALELISLPRNSWCFEPGDHMRLAQLIDALKIGRFREEMIQANFRAVESASPQAVAIRLAEFLSK